MRTVLWSVLSTFHGIGNDIAPANMKKDIRGNVHVNHLRRPNVSMVLIAGRPKKKLTAPSKRGYVSLGIAFSS